MRKSGNSLARTIMERCQPLFCHERKSFLLWVSVWFSLWTDCLTVNLQLQSCSERQTPTWQKHGPQQSEPILFRCACRVNRDNETFLWSLLEDVLIFPVQGSSLALSAPNVGTAALHTHTRTDARLCSSASADILSLQGRVWLQPKSALWLWATHTHTPGGNGVVTHSHFRAICFHELCSSWKAELLMSFSADLESL